MMGCNSSMDTNSVLDEPLGGAGGGLTTGNGLGMPNSQWPLSQANRTDVVREFVRLDEKISKLEGTCPGPRLATCEAWIEHLQSKRNEMLGLEAYQLRGTARDGPITNQASSSVPQTTSNVQVLPSHVLDNNELHIEGFTSEQGLPYYNNNAVAVVASGSGGVAGGYSSLGGGGGGAGGVGPAKWSSQQNAFLPLPSNLLIANGVASNGGVGGGGGTATAGGMGIGAAHSFPSNNIAAKTPSQDLLNLALNLGVIVDVPKASTHEDFFAQLSESALHLMTLRCFAEILEHTKVRLKMLMESYAELNELYVNHDGIIAFISGGTYMSRLEESLDSQLETARDVRDKLGSTLEQWRICGLLLRASANSSTQSLKQWRKLKTIINPKDKLETALACRKDLQASLVSLECAQLALPHVEIKYTSNRQILAVKHCNTYMVTDIANLARYEHTSKVFATYESSISKAATWLYETFNKTLRQDFDRAEETVNNLAKTLRDHREEIFSMARK